MKTAIYARVSTGLQALEGTSLDGQIELCQKKADELNVGRENVLIYREEGASGEDIDRPEMNQLRNDVTNGLIKRVIIVHPDRLSRDLTDKLIVCKEFEKNEVELIFVDTEYKNTPEGQLFFNMQSAIAQYELAMIRKRTMRGKLKAVEKQNKVMPMRVPTYGYDLLDGAYSINEVEANFVRKVYEWYVYDNLTLRQIGEKLYSLGAMPKRKESPNWSSSSIQRILSTETYTGKYYYNRRKTKKIKGEKTKSGKSKYTYEFRDPSEWIVVTVPQIISPELFQLAKERKAKNLRRSGNVKREYLLKSMLTCGNCGKRIEIATHKGKISKKTGERKIYTMYRCRNHVTRKYGEGIERCINRKAIRTEKVDDYVWNLIVDVLSETNRFEIDVDTKTEKVTEEIVTLINIYGEQYKKKEKEKEKIKTMFMKDLISEEEMERDIQKINVEMNNLNTEINKLNTRLDENTLSNVSDQHALDTAKSAKEKLTNPDGLTFEEKRFIVETLIDEIIIKKEGEDISITCIGVLDKLIAKRMAEGQSFLHTV